mmetsp:Transcript_27249/g.43380  ORF Transcript_27249/g.43380 Transcript_27249/m.43380 type:complete len:360 (-) Transcript_27249:278-1357(-)
MPNIAMIISEKQKIPMIGFVLQPSVIPSEHTVAVEAINTHYFGCFDRLEEGFTGHNVQSWLKWSQENAPALGQVNSRRARYRLEPLDDNSFQVLKDNNMPIVIPINNVAFGTRPSDWKSNTLFTEFIFLKQEKVAQLDCRFIDFIDNAKAVDAPIVLMAFSSMPVSRSSIMDIAERVITQCKKKPRVIAMVSKAQSDALEPAQQDTVQALEDSGQLLVATEAPFSALFPLVSCLVVHGGLGTTADAMKTGHPIIVTGVLLMDQRFWGRRIADLSLGPEPVHISNFGTVCVSQVDTCLDDSWVEHCKKVSESMWANTSDDGIEENVAAIQQLYSSQPEPWVTPPSQRCCGGKQCGGCTIS